MSDKFGEGRDPYLYPGLDIMRNRLNIRQQQRLEQAAYEMTALRAATIEALARWFGVYRICVLFIASCIRIFSTGRGPTARSRYLSGRYAVLPLCLYRKEGNALMQDLEEEGYLVGLEKAKFVERLAHYY